MIQSMQQVKRRGESRIFHSCFSSIVLFHKYFVAFKSVYTILIDLRGEYLRFRNDRKYLITVRQFTKLKSMEWCTMESFFKCLALLDSTCNICLRSKTWSAKDLPFLNPACSVYREGPVISMLHLSGTLLRTFMVTENSIIIVVIVCEVFVSDSDFSFS